MSHIPPLPKRATDFWMSPPPDPAVWEPYDAPRMPPAAVVAASGICWALAIVLILFLGDILEAVL